MIIYKLWRAHSRIRSVVTSSDSFKKIIRIVLDSGLIYTISIVAYFITILTNSNAIYGVSDSIVPIIVSS